MGLRKQSVGEQICDVTDFTSGPRRYPEARRARGVVELKSEGRMERYFDVVIEKDEEGYYVASVPQLPGCHTQARSLDEVSGRIREAIQLCLEVEGVPPKTLEFVGIQRVSVAA